MSDTMPPPRSISGWNLAKEAYAFCFANGDAVLRTTWVVLPILVAIHIFQARIEAQVGPDNPMTGGQGLLGFALSLAYIVFATAMIVSWHRQVYLRELPPAFLPAVNRRVALYFLWGIVIGLLLGVAAGLAGFLLSFVMSGQAGAGLAVVVGVLLAAIAFVRLTPFFPSIAVDEQRLTLGEAWQLTKGSGWSLFLGLVAVFLPLSVIGQVVLAILGITLVGSAIMAVITVAQILLATTFASFALRDLRAARTSQAPFST